MEVISRFDENTLPDTAAERASALIRDADALYYSDIRRGLALATEALEIATATQLPNLAAEA